MKDIALPSWQRLITSWKKIIAVSMPVALTSILMSLSIGIIIRMLSSIQQQAVAAFGIATRLEAIVFIVLMAVSTAISPFVGQNWGAGNYHRMYRAMNISYGVSLLWGAIVAIVLAVVANPVVRIFTQDERIIYIACKYLYIVPFSYAGYGIVMIVSAAFNASGRPLRASGTSLLRMFGLYIPLALVGKLLFGFMGIFSAASIANIVAAIAALWWFKRCRPSEISDVSSATCSDAQLEEETILANAME